ncbi:MAG: M23 family metallopeptidase [Acetatifactor sp.]|nr:M23 family metallopeptidase [Acetatifactor sp.]
MMKQNLNELWQAVYEEDAEFKSVNTANIKKRVNKAINNNSMHISAVLIPVMVLIVTILFAGTLLIIRNPERQEDDGKDVFDNVQWMSGQSKTEKMMSVNDNDKETMSIPITEEYATDAEDPLGRIRSTILKDGFYYVPARKGDDVLSVCDGTVTGAGWESGYGYCVSILDAEGRTWKYAHCNETLVNIGDDIHVGDLIAYAGSTGLVTENAIHIKLIDSD